MNKSTIGVLKHGRVLRCLVLIAISVLLVTSPEAYANEPPDAVPGAAYVERDRSLGPLLRLGTGLAALEVALLLPGDGFQFPLLQTLYHSSSRDVYLVMVSTTLEINRLVPVVLERDPASDSYVSTGGIQMRLTDKGSVKRLETSADVYEFRAAGDGEWHVRKVHHHAGGGTLTAAYRRDGLIAKLYDDRGRTAEFGYNASTELGYIRQTWRNGASVRETSTWVRNTEPGSATWAALAPLALFSGRKTVPINAVAPSYSSEMKSCDQALADVFGGSGAVAAGNGFEPIALASRYPWYRGDLVNDEGEILTGHLSRAIHLYGAGGDGTKDSEIFVPAGFTRASEEPSPTDAAVTFYYPQLGTLVSVTLVVFHVADFKLEEQGARVRVGRTGGPGGDGDGYHHSHIDLLQGNIVGMPSAEERQRLRLDPKALIPCREVVTNAQLAEGKLP